MRKLAAGNWKMNGSPESFREISALLDQIGTPGCEVLICPPATLLAHMGGHAQGRIAVGGQDCHTADAGAHTGDISAPMLKDAGATYVILGHSERRADHGETSETVAAKTAAAWRAGLVAVICVGETLEERESGRALDVVTAQLATSVPDGATAENTVVAYEPVWAIGTGRTASPENIAEVHDAMRAALAGRLGQDVADGIRLLYGGSVKAANAAEIFAASNVDGALVGGASLKAADFAPIVAALDAA